MALGLCGGSLGALSPARADFVARYPATHGIGSERLRLEIADPVDPDRYYRGLRFSPVAAILQATWDGKDCLFAPVEHDPLRDNGGLAMEFDLSNPAWPPGFAEAGEGGEFVKIGVGILKRQGERYAPWIDYEVVRLARTTAECAPWAFPAASPLASRPISSA